MQYLMTHCHLMPVNRPFVDLCRVPATSHFRFGDAFANGCDHHLSMMDLVYVCALGKFIFVLSRALYLYVDASRNPITVIA